MKMEFTGERVIPGQIEADLWNEHFSRYAFALRLCAGRTVLDVACGTGYGPAEIASRAQAVFAVDISSEAVTYASAQYGGQSLQWAQASCTDLPFPDATFDVVLAFEVIEHLDRWPRLLSEARRVLTPGGQFIVSTPNKHFYAESRSTAGPNPYHKHEFEYSEFRESLQAFFPYLQLFVQDHTEGVLFRPVSSISGTDVRLELTSEDPATANFFLAVGSVTEPPTPLPAFIYIPHSGNVLRERALHIHRLEEELATKDDWLVEARREHGVLVEMFRRQTGELEERNLWAKELTEQITARGQRILQLQEELKELAAGYESQIAQLQSELETRTHWARESESRLQFQTAELGRCVDLLHATERILEERTSWALELESEREVLAGEVSAVHASRWFRLGKLFGVGPELRPR